MVDVNEIRKITDKVHSYGLTEFYEEYIDEAITNAARNGYRIVSIAEIDVPTDYLKAALCYYTDHGFKCIITKCLNGYGETLNFLDIEW